MRTSHQFMIKRVKFWKCGRIRPRNTRNFIRMGGALSLLLPCLPAGDLQDPAETLLDVNLVFNTSLGIRESLPASWRDGCF